MPAPLEGLKVLELARILAGPIVGQTLADLGATVIKVESPKGDDTRSWGPPFIEREGEDAPSAAYFYSCNRGKYSVTADLATEEGRAFVTDLARDADVLIENFKVGGLAKYGLDYASLSNANPRLVYCSITGFGQTGPYADRAGYDYLVQGMSGLMSITGDPNGEPQKVGVAVTDIYTGLYSVIAIQAALTAREKTGKGQHIDMSLLDAGTGSLANQAMNFLATGQSPKRMGNQHPNIVPYEVFPVSDGDIIIAAGNDRQFQGLCEVLGRQDLATVPDYETNAGRVKNRELLVPLLKNETASWTKSDLLAALKGQKVPASPINTVEEVFSDPQIAHREMQITPEGIPGVRTPITFSDADLALTKSAPLLGAHTEEVRQRGWFIGG
ncbi:CaiB/BaiF CoA transferase family protein [Marivita hallyeonensis]|uniref:Crotonobetainyl-CoA:carnitine CoA-transferase CaiB n=1 Tax=Marivita hallyeonensis TaxID=996342 RepID=A0A1M5X3T6_9RHOB|nr:CaiB/BaiF CoA-transferase family protein [Marivita hallyeonensis]SHH94262.1 Crotonobetainyl-CoA:carnitine CoA-transferase CaiB [Marivita hallyeonensis]